MPSLTDGVCIKLLTRWMAPAPNRPPRMAAELMATALSRSTMCARRRGRAWGSTWPIYDKAGVKVMSYEGTADVMSYYPETVKDWGANFGEQKMHAVHRRFQPLAGGEFSLGDPLSNKFLRTGVLELVLSSGSSLASG
jgi:hypothetical protein